MNMNKYSKLIELECLNGDTKVFKNTDDNKKLKKEEIKEFNEDFKFDDNSKKIDVELINFINKEIIKKRKSPRVNINFTNINNEKVNLKNNSLTKSQFNKILNKFDNVNEIYLPIRKYHFKNHNKRKNNEYKKLSKFQKELIQNWTDDMDKIYCFNKLTKNDIRCIIILTIIIISLIGLIWFIFFMRDPE